MISTLPDLIRVWRGDFSLASAVIAGRVEIHGSVRLCKAFHSWLATSEQANIPPASPAARATGPAGDDDAVSVPVSEAADIV